MDYLFLLGRLFYGGFLSWPGSITSGIVHDGWLRRLQRGSSPKLAVAVWGSSSPLGVSVCCSGVLRLGGLLALSSSSCR